MKQIAVISGKGGTGKTTITGSFASLSKAGDIIMADCDVEAPNLHLIMGGEDVCSDEFSGARVAVIDPDKCSGCGICSDVCRFGAIENCTVNSLKCEGCGTCSIVCPEGAVEMKDEITGKTYITDCEGMVFSHARLEIGADGSGKLVTRVRKNAVEHLEEQEYVIIDGSPGIGCVVIASITGCDAALIVTEPTRSGLEDLRRVLSTCRHFGVKSFVCINKFDLNTQITGEIEEFCRNEGLEVVGRIPYDDMVIEGLKDMKPAVEMEGSQAGRQIRSMYLRIMKLLKEEDADVTGNCYGRF